MKFAHPTANVKGAMDRYVHIVRKSIGEVRWNGKKGSDGDADEKDSENKEAAMERWHGVKVEMHPTHKVWCKDEKEERHTSKVQSFLSKLRWQKDESCEGGITWIELYALHSIHGGSQDEDTRREKEPCKKPPMLQEQDNA